jgi:uncharacterized membrane protein
MYFLVIFICVSLTVALYLSAEKEDDAVGKAWLLLFSVVLFIFTVYFAKESMKYNNTDDSTNNVEVLYNY